MSSLQKALVQRRLENHDAPVFFSSSKLQIPCLRAKTSDGKEWMIPWAHLMYGCYVEEPENDLLTLIFTTHEVVITGQNLAALVGSAARLTLEKVKPAPVQCRNKCEGESVVLSVQIRTISDSAYATGPVP